MYGSEILSRPKTVAFDFDNTISANPTLFLAIMQLVEKAGWFVVIVTYRKPDCYPEDLDYLVKRGYKIYFTSQTAKQKFMEDQGVDIDIWIDDEPETIIRSYDIAGGDFYDE